MTASYDQNPALKKALVFYKGPLSNEIVFVLGKKIQNNPLLDLAIARKVFAVYMELAENILRYSDQEKKFTEFERGVGSICIFNQKDNVIISTHNIVRNEFIPALQDQCNVINSLKHLELRKYKREQRSQPRFLHSKGASIGLINCAIFSKSKIDIKINKIDNIFSYLTLTFTVKK